MNLVRLDVGPKAPANLSAELRALADAVDRGEVTAFVGAMVTGENFEFLYGASVRSCLEMATLLQRRCLLRYDIAPSPG